MSNRTLIIGAGLAGLSAAYHLKDEYIIFEKENRVGGLCRSEVIGGFTFDYSIHILYSSNEYATKLIKDVLLKGNFHSQPRESWVYSKGVFTEYPFQANTYGLPVEVRKECIMGLIEARYESKYPNPENFEQWIYKTFGSGIAKHFMIPYNRKQWAIEPELMGYDRITERVPVPAIEEVLDGALRKPQKKFGSNKEFWYPVKGGIEALPKGFLPFVEDHLEVNCEVVKIHSRKKLIELRNGETVSYEKLVYTLPLPMISKLFDEVPPAVRRAVEGLEYNIIYTVNLGINRPNISSFHWVYFPEGDFIFHRISFPMNFHKSCAPEGKSSIMCEVSESRYKRVNKETLIQDCIRDLQKAKVLRKDDEILVATVHTLNPAYVIYDLDHRKKVKLIHDFLRSRNIYPAGRFGEWEYLNMDHSILSGKRAAEEVMEVEVAG
jgi:UDP-galactopyranose mutase